MNIQVGDIVRLKKPHPCGASEWRVLRAGADFRIECRGCGHQLMLARPALEKRIREVIPGEKSGGAAAGEAVTGGT
ncbi:DUF951 domain-containing protein [Lachnoclostridium sp. Marseille-P6806]|uniref:DUF951 domain-containing protein n=1 Tax=Lachnoclostridium sp. Marseille-P6806 TaxID=2364793 RepID=UPI00102FE765|nr:DUF951 domain-containing protein [Lachnoclostridium sp. Marseille-P6806]